MTQEQRIIDYIAEHGSSFSYEISAALGIKAVSSALKKCVANGDIFRSMTRSTGRGGKGAVAFYSMNSNEDEMFRRRVKAVNGMAPVLTDEQKHYVNPFKIKNK